MQKGLIEKKGVKSSNPFFGLKEKTILTCVLGLITVVFVSSISAQAFTPSGWVWESGYPYRNPHKYYPTTTIWGQFSTAVSDWSGTEFGTMQMSQSPDDAVVTVRARDEGEEILGRWEPINYSGWTLYTARITLNSYYSDTLTSSQKREVCGHELGHDLGLNDVYTTYPAQIMYYYAQYNFDNGIYTPQSGQDADIWGVNSIY